MNLSDDFDNSVDGTKSGGRTLGRELALKLLYLADIRGIEEAEAEQPRLLGREAGSDEAATFARDLYKGVTSQLEALDAQIAETATNWDLGRMAYIDRAILRMGAFEILHRDDIPPKASISEAIELAKRYSTDKSASFVNGILDHIFQTCRPDKT